MICKTCATRVHELEVFPGTLCLNCYAKTVEDMTPQEALGIVMKTFGGSNV
jgi:hypothetical protein